MKIGAHVGISGGLTRAVERAKAIDADCIQIFAGPPSGWRPAAHGEEMVAAFRAARASAAVAPLFLHGIYLMNFGTSREDLYERSIDALRSYLEWCVRFDGDGVIFHLGSATGTSPEEAEDRVVSALDRLLREEGESSGAAILIENSAGMGASLGCRFEQIGQIMGRLDHHPRLRVCLDTQHSFAAGYDDATEDGLNRMLESFDLEIGLERLAAIHANDSKVPLGRGLDRHENIGKGFIGESGFHHILTHPALQNVPFILEVPGYGKEGPDPPNVQIMRWLAAGNSPGTFAFEAERPAAAGG